jgi:aryl-alcohol dehydrogenase-like predicted oxidoreductase
VPRLESKGNSDCDRGGFVEYATLGNTGLLVSKFCFGTMTFGDSRGLFNGISAVDQAGADELIKTAIDGGINFFDTADNYSEGLSEKILGQSLKMSTSVFSVVYFSIDVGVTEIANCKHVIRAAND